MNHKDLIKQYVDSGQPIPRYQYNQLSGADKRTYLRKIEIRINSEDGVRFVKYYYGELPDEKIIELLKRDSNVILDIENPSEAVQMAAVKINPYQIGNIKTPSEAVQMAAVEQNYKVTHKITNPSEAVQMAAVKTYVDGIGGINNPTEKVQISVVKRQASMIQLIKNPTERVQIMVVNQSPNLIKYIKNPTEKVQTYIIKKIFELNDFSLIGYLNNLSEKNSMLFIQLQDKMLHDRIKQNEP